MKVSELTEEELRALVREEIKSAQRAQAIGYLHLPPLRLSQRNKEPAESERQQTR